MLAASVQRLKALQDTVDHERVVLVTHSNQVTMTFRVCGLVGRAIRFGDIDADWVATYAFDHFVKLEVLQGKDS